MNKRMQSVCTLTIALLFIPVGAAFGSPVIVWQAGVDEDPFSPGYAPTDEFAPANYSNTPAPGSVTRVPGDPLYNAGANPAPDDDFYFAGTYPAGFNALPAALSVALSEPQNAWPRELHTANRTNRAHFFLSAAQAGPASRLRLSFELVWGGLWYNLLSTSGEGFGEHDIVVRFRNASGQSTLVWSNRIDRGTTIVVDFPASSVAASAGPNTIEISRTGPNPADISHWVQFDFARLEAESDALVDADGDGLPRWWETDHHLSEVNSADAGVDADGDALSALQEYNGGTQSTDPHRADTDGDGLNDNAERTLGSNPLKPDTDGDSLTDGEEVNGVPASNPLLVDSDGDGSPDSLERRVGTNPTNASNAPTVFRGGIGINFVSENDLNGIVGTNEAAGIIPQTRWNGTFPVRPWNRPAGSQADIVTPLTNQLVRSDGAVVPGFTYNWTGDATGASANTGSPDRRLMSGFLRASTTTPLALSLNGIPFASYDLYLVVGGTGDGQRGRVRLGAAANTDRFFRTTTTAPQAVFAEIRAGATNHPYGNLVIYTNLTSANATVNLTSIDGWALGIHAVQIIDRTLDQDGSGIPDWWELKHALQPGSTALAATDLDGDTLSNLLEFQRGSDPRRADTDGDGLSDHVESASNALTADSDNDGLADGAEVNAAIPSNPNLPDTDGDGVNDKEEVRLGTDPTYNPGGSPTFTGWVPRFQSTPSRWEWNIENVQLVWDHKTGGLAPNIWNEDQLISFGVKNPAAPDWRTLGMELRLYNGSLTHIFHSERTGAFSASGQPSNTIWDGDYGSPPADLTTKLGFSGHGPADLSDRLQFRLFAQRGGSASSWTVTFEVRNQTSNTVVVARTFANSTAVASVDNGTAQWTDLGGSLGKLNIVVHQGVKLFITPTPLATLPAFAHAKDSDKDGMPDTWEETNLFNKLSAADAALDADADGLINRDEFLTDTNPRVADTDGDGVSDALERLNSSDPLVAASKPLFAGQSWPGGSDLDGNGLADAWEVRFRALGLDPSADADGDGVSNGRESREGTNPFDANSVVFVGLTRENDDAVVEWPVQSAKSQSLLISTNLPEWKPFGGSIQTSGGMASARLNSHFLNLPLEFYRIATTDRDTDGDGVTDWDEAVLGSDPSRANSVRAATPIINGSGQVTGSLAGDRAAFVQQMQGGPGGGANVTRVQAARLLQQATFGPTPRELDRVQQLGIAGWIDDQLAQPPTWHRPYVEEIYADFNGPRTDLTYTFDVMNHFLHGNNSTTPFARAAIGGPDQLRQRVAFALSQILVTSRRDPALEEKPLAMTDYYDHFVRHAFGNYLDVLREVTFHPAMGRYLSHVGNQKARPEINQYPDENYAREVMQLFSIGLWELHPDGTRRLDALDQPIPTYGNAQITEFARVFTGLWFGGQAWGNGGWADDDLAIPMQMWAEKHDFDEKTLLNGFVIPARKPTVENGVRDVEDALRNLFNHPNTGPFIGRQLIQFLVTSNPSTDYVARVAAVFANDGSGNRGNLAAVVKAVLLDVEARDVRWSAGAPEFGRLKEPVHRAMAIARVGGLEQYPKLLWWNWGDFTTAAFQEPGYSPSVFNFFRPGYQPPGLLTQNGLVGPAFQITDSYSSISFPNKLWEITQFGLRRYEYSFAPDYAELLTVADDVGALVDQVNLLFAGGSMSATTRDNLVSAVNQVPIYDRLMRVRLAVYLAATCPEGAVQR